MTINLTLPDEIITSTQKEKVDKMMRELQDYRMKPEEDIIQHLITVNQKMQEGLWNGHELITKNKVQYLTLRGTLIEREHQIILDQLWKTLVPRTYWNLVIYFVKFIISYGARKIARQSVGSRKLIGKKNVFDIPWMDKLVVRKLPKEFQNSIPVIKIEEEEDLEESSNWILFAELDGVEPTEDLTALGEEHRAQESCMVAPISYVDSQSTIRGIDIDLNVASDIDVVGDDGYDNSDPCDHEVDSDSDLDVDEVPDDIYNEDLNDDGNINVSSVKNQIRCIVIHNNPGAHMSLIDPDATHVVGFLEYPEILPTHQLAVDFDLEELFVGQRFESKEKCVFAIKWYNMNISVDYKVQFQYRVSYRKMRIAKQMEMVQLYGDFNASYNELQRWIAAMQEKATLMPRMGQQQVNRMNAGHVFVEDVRDAMVVNCWMARSINVERPSVVDRVCDCRRFQTHNYPCTHVAVACVKVSFNVEQFIDDVYTLECMLRVWENEFPVLPDLSTWEVPPTTFELVPDKRLRRNPKSRPQSSRIYNEMDIREKFDGKNCGLCRLASHNWSKCLQ
ncbi:hypothetical protein GOBAR_DD22032 [Gossypium barbadense]|nr:hypothetical protein GOBAR_DD22032 [Gossypium barbadense]